MTLADRPQLEPLTRRQLWADVAAAVVFGYLCLITSQLTSVSAVAAAAVLTVTVALRRKFTEPVFFVALLVGLAHLLTTMFVSSFVAAVPVLLYGLARRGRWSVSLAGLGAGLLASAGLAAVDAASWPGATVASFFGTMVGTGFFVVVAWSAGTVRRQFVLREEAEGERLRMFEAGREQQVRLAVAAERARIAREMHDVIAHSLAVVIAQADGGRYAARTSPAAAEQALSTIAENGRSALAEMRRLLGVLRDTSDDDVEPSQPDGGRIPQPTLGELPALVERVRSGGLPVSLDVEGMPRAVSGGIQLTAYRVIQEGLTNVLKHAGPAASAKVHLRWARDRLVVEVLDDGRGAAASPPPGSGNGIIGMRERAALDGGVVLAGPRPGGGFAVRLELPIAEYAVSGS